MTEATKIYRRAGLGWVEDDFDARDHRFMPKVAHRMAVPDRIDLTARMPPVRDQLQLGCCTGFGISGVIDHLHCVDPTWAGPSSPLFVYYLERVMEGTVKQDAGAQIRDGIKAVAKTGACLETLWKYDPKVFAKKPNAAAYKDAGSRKVGAYQRITSKDEMLQALAGGQPFVFGFVCYEGLMSDETAKTGVLPMPEGRSIGGHCVVCVGYDKPTDRFLIRNSWGTGWGIINDPLNPTHAGHFWMPAAYITNLKLADDMWVVSA